MNNQTKVNTRVITSTLAGIGGATLTKRLIKELRPEGKTDSIVLSLGFLALEVTVFVKTMAVADGIAKGIFDCAEKIKELRASASGNEEDTEEVNNGTE